MKIVRTGTKAMSADAFIVYFGVRYAVESEEELDRLERRNDPRLESARKSRLKTFLGRATADAPGSVGIQPLHHPAQGVVDHRRGLHPRVGHRRLAAGI